MARDLLPHSDQPVGTPEDPPLLLVVDDDAVNVALLADLLSAVGYRVEGARSGPTSLERARTLRPDLILLDIMMPGMSGIEVCRRLRADPVTADIPVVFVTALAETEDRIEAIEAGGDDFVTKPFNRAILLARIRSLLRLKSTRDELRRAYRRQRDLERLKDDLVRMVVHDLKSPLSAVLATLEMLVDGDFGPLTGEQRRLVSDARGRGEDILALVDDLLDISRLEHSEVKPELTRIEARRFLDEVVGDWAMRSELRGMDLEGRAPEGLFFEADERLVRRVFWNLIGNAARHAGPDVRVRVQAEPIDDTGSVEFSVVDDGPGIDPDRQKAVFEKFATAGSALARSSTGLGLTFCRLAVEAHGGRIWIDGEAAAGTTVRFTIPGTEALMAGEPGVHELAAAP